MGVAESVNDAVRVMISTASIPTVKSGVWAELNHSKRRGSAWIRMPVASRSDPRVDLVMEGAGR